jgi:hypothetical protein
MVGLMEDLTIKADEFDNNLLAECKQSFKSLALNIKNNSNQFLIFLHREIPKLPSFDQLTSKTKVFSVL